MTIKEIEQAIIKRLRDKLKDIKGLKGLIIESFPDKPDKYKLLSTSAVLVIYKGSSFSKSETTDLIIQDQKVIFGIYIITKNLATNQGLYDYIDTVRTVLTGYKIPGCSKMYPTSENFISEESGVWMYVIDYSMITPAIELPDEEQIIAITQAIFKGNFEDVEVSQ